MNLARLSIHVAFLTVGILPTLPAQQLRPGPDWFLRQLFLLADFNGDGQLNRAEAAHLSSQWDYYHEETGFTQSDLDQDQLLSIDELRMTAWKAMLHRLSTDEQELRRLHQQYSHLGGAQLKYLQRHPQVAASLLGNVVWVREHESLVKKLAKDRAWLRENPEAADALQNNFILWMESPSLARGYYERPPAGSDAAMFEAWRSLHKHYLRSATKAKAFVPLEFPYIPLPDSIEEAPVATTPIEENTPEIEEVPALSQETFQRTNPAAFSQNIATEEKGNDSLREALHAAESRIKRLETVLAALSTEQQAPSLPNSDTQLNDLQQQLRTLQIERKLARIEEDSLLATTIRQRKQIAFLESERVRDSLLFAQTKQDPAQERRTLSREITELKTSLTAQKAVSDSLQRELSRQQALFQSSQQQLAAMRQALPVASANSEERTALQQSLRDARDSLRLSVAQKAAIDYSLQSSRLQADSLRLRLLQANLDRQGTMDSLLTLHRLASRRADSLANSVNTPVAEENNLRVDSLMASLRQAERLRLTSEQYWQQQIDSLQFLLHRPAMASRATDEPDSEEVIAAIRRADEALRYDNQKLREQLESISKLSQEQETMLREQLQAVLKNNRKLEFQNRQLHRRVESRRQPTATVAISRMDNANFELTEARGRIRDLEKVNESLLLQLQASQAYILQRMRQEQQVSNRLGQEIAQGTSAKFRADTLSVALARALQVSWPDTVAAAKTALSNSRREIAMLEERAMLARAQYLKQRDSLTQEILKRDATLAQNQQVSSVDVQRFAKADVKDAELRKKELALAELKQLLDQREIMIAQKIEELSIKEVRYQSLNDWEAELKRREQQLKAKSGAE